MFAQLTLWLFPLFGLMASGALLLLGVVLWKGDLCPGQRARITTQLFSVWVMTALSVMLGLSAGAPLWLIAPGGMAVIAGFTLSILQSRLDAKRSIPSRWIGVPALPLVVYGALLVAEQSGAALSQLIVLGCAFAHLMLLRARHRLQAFNLLLPLGGLMGALAGLLWLGAMTLMQQDVALLDTLIPWVLGYSLLMVLALGIWFLPLLSRRDTAPVVLSSALFTLLVSQCAGARLFGLL